MFDSFLPEPEHVMLFMLLVLLCVAVGVGLFLVEKLTDEKKARRR